MATVVSPAAFATLSANVMAIARPASGVPLVVGAEELRLLYAQKHDWARHYNSLIWSITAILLPVSLGGLALTFRNAAGVLNKPSLFFAAFGSLALLAFWNRICDGQRKLWEREVTIASLIEGIWGVRRMPASPEEAPTPLLPTGAISIKVLRNAIAIAAATLWIAKLLVELAA